MNEDQLRQRVLLSLQVALWGEIGVNVRSVSCSWNESRIDIWVTIDGEIDADSQESFECVSTEMMSHFPDHIVVSHCGRSDFPERLSKPEDADWVFIRKE